MKKDLKNIDFIIFDLDGVFYRGGKSLDGVKEIISFLNQKEINYCFFTNNSSYELSHYKNKLKSYGINISKKQIINTTKIINHYLKLNKIKEIYVLGSKSLKASLYKNRRKNKKAPEAVILGMNNDIKLKDISKTIGIINKDCQIIASNPDKLIPTENHYDLECGVIIDIIEEFTQKKVNILGKPNIYGFDYIFKEFNVNKDKTIMIGDTYETDIKGAINSNIKAGWIKTGNKLPKEVNNKKDFFVFDSLFDLKNKLS